MKRLFPFIAISFFCFFITYVVEAQQRKQGAPQKAGQPQQKIIQDINRDLMAAVVEDDVATIQALLANRANVNGKNRRGLTVLMLASAKGRTDIVEALLAKGANVNAKDWGGRTALMFAAWGGHIKTAEILVSKGADISAKDSLGASVYMYARTRSHRDFVDAMQAKGLKDESPLYVEGLTKSPLYIGSSGLAFIHLISGDLEQIGIRQPEMTNPELVGKRDINKDQINFYPLDKDVSFGRQFAQEVDRSVKLVEDPITVEYVNIVGQNLVLHSDAKVPFTIKVIDSDIVSAFALPGGFLYINKGLILTADNEAQLAGQMAHLIAHVAARHGTEQVSAEQYAGLGRPSEQAILKIVAPFKLIALNDSVVTKTRKAAPLLLPQQSIKFSNEDEEEADVLAAQYLWSTGYDPNVLVTLFERMQVEEKRERAINTNIFKAHWDGRHRIYLVNALIRRFPDRSEYTVNTSEFNQVKNRLIALTNARLKGASANLDSQRPSLKRKQGLPEASGTKATKALTNGDIIALAKDGLSEANLIETIKEASAVQFDLSPEAQRNLLRNSISNEVIAAMRLRQAAKQK